MKKHPWFHFIFPVMFVLMGALILIEGAMPGNKSSSQSKLFASLFDHGEKVANIITPEAIRIEGNSNIYIGKSSSYNVSFTPQDTSDQRVDYEVISGKDNVTVEENTIKAIKEGDVTIKATSLADNRLTDTFTIHILKEPITRLTLSINKSSIKSGETFRISVKETDIKDVDLHYDTDYFTSQKAGYLKAIRSGNTTIYATLKDDKAVSSEKISIRIEKEDHIAPTSLSYDEEKTIYVNETLDVQPIFNSGCNDSLFYITLDGIEEDDSRISFEETGEHSLSIHSIANPSLTADCQIHVVECKARGIRLDQSTIQYGKTTKLEYELISEKEGIKVTNEEMIFESSDKSILSITEDGYALGLEKGTVQVTIAWKEDKSVSQTFDINVISMDVTKYDHIHSLIRKLVGHYGCFLVTAIFGILTCFLFFFDDKKGKYWSTAIFLLVGLILAILSEVLQIFTSDRGPAASDVMIDFAGYLTGYILSYIIYLIIRKKKRNKNCQPS